MWNIEYLSRGQTINLTVACKLPLHQILTERRAFCDNTRHVTSETQRKFQMGGSASSAL